jgi:metal-responsive CopG/Arc/MetJ family transcriptional regulator
VLLEVGAFAGIAGGIPERVVVMMPPALTALLDAEAERVFTTRSELIRRTLLERLRARSRCSMRKEKAPELTLRPGA